MVEWLNLCLFLFVGRHLDVLARSFLWNRGLGYNHGTGHGIGHYLSVHEGLSSLSVKGFACILCICRGIFSGVNNRMLLKSFREYDIHTV